LAQRKNIQVLADDTSSLLKQNVYQNYTQVIVNVHSFLYIKTSD
jgi:hypothetical protein